MSSFKDRSKVRRDVEACASKILILQQLPMDADDEEEWLNLCHNGNGWKIYLVVQA